MYRSINQSIRVVRLMDGYGLLRRFAVQGLFALIGLTGPIGSVSTFVLGALLAVRPAIAASKVYVPTDDAQIVATVPASVAVQGLNRMRSALARDPNNFALGVRVAQRLIELSRSDGDPRYLGYAQAALKPWWDGDRPELILLRATIRQSMHEFEPALADLKQLNRSRSADAQALLTQATIELVLGRYSDALKTCAQLQLQTPGLISEACGADARSLVGHFDAYETLNARLSADSSVDADTRGWLHTMLAEMLERQNRYDEAHGHFEAAVRLAPTLYARAAYADFLLARGRAEQALQLVSVAVDKQSTRGVPLPDVLLLRQVLALHWLGRADLLKPALADMRARFEASRSRGQSLHGREEARLVLSVEADPSKALALAEQNWSIQKEAADTLILAQAAHAAGREDVLRKIRQFVAQTGFKDLRLAVFLDGAAK